MFNGNQVRSRPFAKIESCSTLIWQLFGMHLNGWLELLTCLLEQPQGQARPAKSLPCARLMRSVPTM